MDSSTSRTENEDAGVRIGHGENIRLKDENGNVWSGAAEERNDQIYYRFRDSCGRSMTGVSTSTVLVLRDERGNVWRGFVD